jgi:hypothetical protein
VSPTDRQVYIERATIGWRIVAEASPRVTGLPLWTAVRRWTLTRENALLAAKKMDALLDETIAYHRERIARRGEKRRREVL